MEYKRQKPGKKSAFSDSFKRMVAEEILSGSIFIAAAAKKYGIPSRSTVSQWIKWYQKNNDIVVSIPTPVPEEGKYNATDDPDRIKELQKALEQAKLNIIGLETLIEVAEEQLKIEIRKKPGTKQ
jgi:transposase-like protein